ncbi:hydrolase [Legionella erythra]|uniref:Carboxypeptidase G2 n=1 Tax=Legionella erythra TaxID=448 RepID=A0A0W0TQZ2_LEGER|nr:hydrolase [Legionella erythra]KTC97991.1 carboxypeptidase G2 [Legionella erythra]
MNKAREELVYSLQASNLTMLEQLHQFCAVNSGTHNLEGLQRIHDVLSNAFEPIADQIDSLTLPAVTSLNMNGDTTTESCGKTLFIRKRPSLKRRILLTGHMDTVYGVNHPFQTLDYIDANHIRGPGVADMKGGLIVILHALSAFEKSNLSSTLGWDVLINSDEEIGSPASSVVFERIAGNYQAGLIYEPAMTPQGTLAKNRRGSGKLTLIVTGREAHVGRAFNEGRNAIAYLAEAVLAIHQLNGQRDGVTINVGKIAGGEALNVVPAKAIAKLDVRIARPEDEQWVKRQLDQIIKQLQQPDYTLSVHGHFGRPVKRVCKATERLFQRIQQAGRYLGLELDWQDSGGCCDGNNLAQHGLPVIDTLGVRGGHIHSSEEYIIVDSLPERAALSALLLYDLASGGLEELAL